MDRKRRHAESRKRTILSSGVHSLVRASNPPGSQRLWSACRASVWQIDACTLDEYDGAMTRRRKRYLKGALLGELRDFPYELMEFARCNVLVYDPEGFLWCELCERAYPAGNLRVVGGPPDRRGNVWGKDRVVLRCAVEGCEGSDLEFCPWDPRLPPRQDNPDYPDVPEPFGHYPGKRPL